jgi:hypothetical protein
MNIVHGNRVVSIKEVQGLTRGQRPEWLPQFIELLLAHQSDVILGVRIEEAKIVTNGSISRMKRTSDGFKYEGPLIKWWDIKKCNTAEEAFALLERKLPKPKQPTGFR